MSDTKETHKRNQGGKLLAAPAPTAQHNERELRYRERVQKDKTFYIAKDFKYHVWTTDRILSWIL